MKNTKIKVTDDQPLDEIIYELEKLGLKKQIVLWGESWVVTNGVDRYSIFNNEPSDTYSKYELTTLSELREMKSNEQNI